MRRERGRAILVPAVSFAATSRCCSSSWSAAPSWRCAPWSEKRRQSRSPPGRCLRTGPIRGRSSSGGSRSGSSLSGTIRSACGARGLSPARRSRSTARASGAPSTPAASPGTTRSGSSAVPRCGGSGPPTGRPSPRSSRRNGSFAFLAATNTAALAKRLATRLKGPAAWPAPPDPDRLAQEVADDFFAGMEVVDALSKGYGFRYAFFWQPLAVAESKSLTPEEQEGVRRQLGLSQELGRTAGARTFALIRARPRPNLHYIADVFNGHPGSVYIDSCHFLPDGNRLIADRMYDVLEGGEARESTTIPSLGRR